MSFARIKVKFAISRSDAGTWGSDPTGANDVRVIRSTEIGIDGRITIKDSAERQLTESEYKRTQVRPGDLLVVRSSGSDAHLGKVGYVGKNALGCSFSNFIQRLTFEQTSSSRFAWYFLNSLDAKQQIRILSSTTTGLQNLSAATIGELQMPMPGIKEQERIADFLDAETALIDSLVADRVRQQTILEERSYAEVSEALLPGVLTDARGDWPWLWMPKISADSPMVRLGYVCRLQNGLTVDGNRDVSGDVVTRPYLRVANVQAGYVELSTVTEVTVPRYIAKRCTLRAGDVLMTEGGDLDKLGRGTVWNGELTDCLHQNHVFALRPELDRLDGDYLALMTQTIHGRCYFESTGSKTTNLASTNSSKILSFPIPLPPVGRQRELVRSTRSRLDSIARARRELDRQLALLTERRQALVAAAVTGQIDVSTARGRGIED
ncbi:restriction endonuclease subunit S [Micromonospora sp. NPDC023644]|uniref:restriction endonuclease subunit S n=1 Tax=Micromonospora sp. NPDC023644 TaxID=3154321 RepID=UPI00340F7357